MMAWSVCARCGVGVTTAELRVLARTSSRSNVQQPTANADKPEKSVRCFLSGYVAGRVSVRCLCSGGWKGDKETTRRDNQPVPIMMMAGAGRVGGASPAHGFFNKQGTHSHV